MWRCCLNPKVLGSLLVVGLGLWLIGAGSAALPVLVSLVCPLSMGVMMWRMRRTRAACATDRDAIVDHPHPASDPRLSALREEIAIARARRQLAPDPDARS